MPAADRTEAPHRAAGGPPTTRPAGARRRGTRRWGGPSALHCGGPPAPANQAGPPVGTAPRGHPLPNRRRGRPGAPLQVRHRARRHRQVQRRRARSARRCQGAAPSRPGGNGPASADEGVPKRQVELDRARSRVTGGGDPHLGGEGAPERVGNGLLRYAGVDVEPDRTAVETVLIDGLGGSHIAKFGWPVRRHHDERHVGLMRLDHRSVQLCGGSTTRGEEYERRSGRDCRSQRDKTRRPLVKNDVKLHPILGRQGERKRRASGTRGDNGMGQSGPQPLVDEGRAERGVHRGGRTTTGDRRARRGCRQVVH